MYTQILLMTLCAVSAEISLHRGGQKPVDLTNQIRSTYDGLGNMVYSSNLENVAGACAKKILEENLWDTAGSHPCNPGNDGQSENLYLQKFTSAQDLQVVFKQAIESWNHEKTLVQGYLSKSSDETDYFRSFVASKVGHYTQLVWKSTNQVGCAAGAQWLSSQLRVVVVCRYAPPGNYYSLPSLKANIPNPSAICKDEKDQAYCNTYKHMCQSVLFIQRACFRTCGHCEKWESQAGQTCIQKDERSDCANAKSYCSMEIIRSKCHKTCEVPC